MAKCTGASQADTAEPTHADLGNAAARFHAPWAADTRVDQHSAGFGTLGRDAERIGIGEQCSNQWRCAFAYAGPICS